MRILFFIFIINIYVYASNYAVVVSSKSKITKLSKKQIKDIFMMKRHFIKKIKVAPINLSASSKLRAKFETEILKTNQEKLNRYWIKKHFQGISPPLTQSSDRAMQLFIKNVDVAIGYLPISLVDTDIKVVYEF